MSFRGLWDRFHPRKSSMCVLNEAATHGIHTQPKFRGDFFLPTIHTVVASFLGPRSCSVFITRRRAGFWRLACTAGMRVAVLGNVSSR